MVIRKDLSIKSTLSHIERVDLDLLELFGDFSENDGFFAYRTAMLQQFGFLANLFHQASAINFLQNSEDATKIFETEIILSKERVTNFRSTAITQIRENLAFLTDQQEKITTNENLIIVILNQLKSEKQLTSTGSNQNLNLQFEAIHSPKLLQSLVFTLEEIRSKILIPAKHILTAEINAAHKILDSVELENLKDQVSLDELGRMCELLSWGFETTNEWQSIKLVRSEVSQNLQRELGTLRALWDNYT
ncbi:MAG: hypothetical protein ACXAB7_20465 [Candidatus Kariarchaeaceae archaeon]|jgi:hypothetical protein